MEEVRKRLGDGELPAWRRPSSCPLGLHLDPHSFHSASPIGLPHSKNSLSLSKVTMRGSCSVLQATQDL